MQFNTSRRELFGLGAAAVAAAVTTGGSKAVASPGSEDLKLGVATYSFRKFNRADMIKGVKALNVKYVNIKDFHLAMTASPSDIAAAKKEIEDAGLTILGCGN